MAAIWTALLQDEQGFIVSGELVMVSTLGVLGLVTGLSEVSQNVNGELKDVGAAFRLNQSYRCTLPNGTVMSYQDQDER
jgi:hypothetical protein